jgi:transposase
VQNKVWLGEVKCRYNLLVYLAHWEAEGIDGLLDKTGRGRKQILSDKKETEIIKLVKAFPKSLKKVLSEIKRHWGN